MSNEKEERFKTDDFLCEHIVAFQSLLFYYDAGLIFYAIVVSDTR